LTVAVCAEPGSYRFGRVTPQRMTIGGEPHACTSGERGRTTRDF
jgi:hypothetical protein